MSKILLAILLLATAGLAFLTVYHASGQHSGAAALAALLVGGGCIWAVRWANRRCWHDRHWPF